MNRPTEMPVLPLLPHLSRAAIEAAYSAAPGNELASGKMASPESSAALVANAFGLFVGDNAHLLPPLPQVNSVHWPARKVILEKEVRFPWAGGRHPWLDVLIETDTHIVGVESKRYEPFRTPKKPHFAAAFDRDVWRPGMQPYLQLLARLKSGDLDLQPVDAAQLVKHALALSTLAAQRKKQVVLVYLFSEPPSWPGGKVISTSIREAHRAAATRFANEVAGAEVEFHTLTYADLFRSWLACGIPLVHDHVRQLEAAFKTGP